VGAVGDTGEKIGGEPARARGPERADELVVRTDPARRDDDGVRRDLLAPHDLPIAGLAPSGGGVREDIRPDAGDGAVGHDDLADPTAEPHLERARRPRVASGADERLEHTRSGAPGDVEAGDRVTPPVRLVTAALGPLH